MRIHVAVRLLLFSLLLLAVPAVSSAGIILTIGIAPPPLPVYEQPLCPGDGYIWTPGYWAYDDNDGYFWVPGTWVMAPETGYLWTPGYWGWGDGVYVFHQGYWGPEVGFYGGVDYGFGYTGAGYAGGYWNHGAFYYNRSVNHIGNVRNVYSKNVVVHTVNRVSYNGGNGGIQARATAQEETAARAHHIPPTSVQTAHVREASSNRQLYESTNHGKPAIAATAKPAEFSGRGVVAAQSAAPSYKPATARSATPEKNTARPNTAVHPNQPAPAQHSATQNSGNQKYQRQPATQRHPVTQRKTPEPSRQQVEQKHQQPEQKHATQQKQVQPKQPAGRGEPKEKEKH